MSMILRMPLILAAFTLALTDAAAQEGGFAPEDAAPPPPAELKALVDSCAAHKFETMVAVEGRRRPIAVKLCGKEGQSAADWLVTLRDSVAKTAANEELEAPVRDGIVAALKDEIARLESVAAAAASASTTTIAVTQNPVFVPEAAPQYSSVPPLPAPKPRVASASATATAGAAVTPVATPRLSLRCALPRETFAACARLERETQLVIRADEDLAAGTSVRFLRGGESRAELEVGALKKGASMREKLPGQLCSGVLRGKVEVQILTKGRVAQTLGPYALYCGS
jgi:hypothetical protein